MTHALFDPLSTTLWWIVLAVLLPLWYGTKKPIELFTRVLSDKIEWSLCPLESEGAEDQLNVSPVICHRGNRTRWVPAYILNVIPRIGMFRGILGHRSSGASKVCSTSADTVGRSFSFELFPHRIYQPL